MQGNSIDVAELSRAILQQQRDLEKLRDLNNWLSDLHKKALQIKQEVHSLTEFNERNLRDNIILPIKLKLLTPHATQQ